ncbi:MAG TPA: NlpC/P60 family protein [Gaiellaceae bacterium]|nr:NlpC/P60 family protein [Gaiellaceae bacterium]
MTYRPLPVRPRLRATRARHAGRRATLVGLVCATVVVALVGAVPALADPRIGEKRAEAQRVLADIEALDAELGQSIEAYNAATIELDAIKADLRANKRQMGVARGNLGVAQSRLASRLRDLYVGGESTSALEVFLGSTSFEDLIDRLDTIDRVSEEDTQVLREVKRFRSEVAVRGERLKQARATQEQVVAERAAAKQEIEAGLAERRRLLSSIREEIVQLRAEEARRQELLARQAAARLASQEAAQQQLIDTSVIGAAAETPEVAVAPPSRYGGVVGIAMQYLGIPYLWGGASPATGFDCSGFIMYVYAQVGVSLPHHAATQYNYGVPVSKDQLQPGDLVFFNGLGHNGMYIGGGQFIHSPHTGDVVKISSLSDSWYAATWYGARRIL